RPAGNPNTWIPLAGPPPLTPGYHELWENNQADVEAGGPGSERIYLDKVAANTLYDQITVFGHSPGTALLQDQKAIRTSNPRPMWCTNVCAEDNIHVSIESEQYYRSTDGKLMPPKKNQAPAGCAVLGEKCPAQPGVGASNHRQI